MFWKNDQFFLSYIYNLSFYHLAENSTEKYQAGLDALYACMNTRHFEEADLVIKQMLNDFPSRRGALRYQYGYLLTVRERFDEAANYLENFEQTPALSMQVNFLRAYTELNYNNPSGSLTFLSRIEKGDFPYHRQIKEIQTALNSQPSGVEKHKAIALPLSLILPGAGQFYAGFYFDALHNFGFNLILGYSAFASWRYESNLKPAERTYILPILSTFVWGLFYISNLYNTANVVDRANLSRWNKHYQAILEKFRFVLKDNAYFMDVQFDIN